MIDKTYINFYSNWYYKKIGNEYQAREKGNIGIITEIKQCPINEFIKKLSKIGEWKSIYEFNEKDILTISNKYPWIKYFHREILISKIPPFKLMNGGMLVHIIVCLILFS